METTCFIIGSKNLGLSARPVMHPTLVDATEEARRLSDKDQLDIFTIFQAVRTVRPARRHEIDDLVENLEDRDVPF